MPLNISRNSRISPLISIVIATLNSGNVIENCLISIRKQKYPNLEILVIDGGSVDSTISIAQKYGCKIYHNPLKTGEAAKAVGLKKATGKYLALIDSDNILPTSDWLTRMVKPLESDPALIGSEPWSYTYRSSGGFVERYCALTGVNDPYALITNSYDRQNYLTKTWNGLNIKTKNYSDYQSFELNLGDKLPSIGANGTIYRKNVLNKYFHSNYLIDVDLLTHILSETKKLSFAKVKCGIIHTYCESSIAKFVKKQNRRVVDLYQYQSLRPKDIIRSHFSNNIKFIFYVIFIFPPIIDSVRGYLKKPDLAWFFHPFACIITLYIYGINTLKYQFGILKSINRKNWRQ